MRGFIVDTDAHCLGAHQVVACGAQPTPDAGSVACPGLMAVACYTRPAADGGTAVLLTDSTLAGAGYPPDLSPCSGDVSDLVATYSQCGP